MSLAYLDAAGGLGLLLLGMAIMTESLRTLGGGALRRNLARFTHSPVSGAASGAVATALLQSSSATTVAAVGFVGAGILTYSQALGIVFGANIGTTATGWLVTLFGFKLNLGQLAFPLILIGVLVRILGKGRWIAIGTSIAGFGLIFFGINAMQQGLHGMEMVLTPEVFPENDWSGRVLLVLIGFLITVITQSSSAGVATALVAVNTGSIGFAQAAAMVIGMDIGTTATTVLATIGASAAARRTGFSHVIYNLLTGLGAFGLLGILVSMQDSALFGFLEQEPELSLVAFHTLFNTLGVMAVLPFAGRFAKGMVRMVPDKSEPLKRRLDSVLLSEPEDACNAVYATLCEINGCSLKKISNLLGNRGGDCSYSVIELNSALREARKYISEIRFPEDSEKFRQQHLELIHILDHTARLVDRCDEEKRARATLKVDVLRPWSERLAESADALSSLLLTGEGFREEVDPKSLWQLLCHDVELIRQEILQLVASGKVDAKTGSLYLKGNRWLRRVAYHLWRLQVHYEKIPANRIGN